MNVAQDARTMRGVAYEQIISDCLKMMNAEDYAGQHVLATQYKEIGNNLIAQAEHEGYEVSAKQSRTGETRIVVKSRN